MSTEPTLPGADLDALLQTLSTWTAVLSALAVAWWLLRRRARAGRAGAGSRRLRHLASLRLGPRAVHLIEADGQRVLVTDGGPVVLGAAHNDSLTATEQSA